VDFDHTPATKKLRDELVGSLQLLLDFLLTEGPENSDRFAEISSTVGALPKLWVELEQDYRRQKMNSYVVAEQLNRQLDFWLGDVAIIAENIFHRSWTELLDDPFLGPVLASLPRTSRLFREVIQLSLSDLTQIRISEVMDLSQPAVRQRVAEAHSLLPFIIGLERLRDDLHRPTGTLTCEFMPHKSSRRLKMPVKAQAVFSILVNDRLTARLFCLAPIDETDLIDVDERRAGLQQRIKQLEEQNQDVPLLIYQFPTDSLQLIFSETASFMEAYPNSLRPRSLEQMRKRQVKVWASFWDWQTSNG